LAVNGLGAPRSDFTNSNAWLRSSRADYVNNINPTDDGPDAITGCSLLFIYYLLISSGSEPSGRLLVVAGRQVSTRDSRTSSPGERQCPCRKAGRSDRCWDVVPTRTWCEHCLIRSLRVLPLAARR
ncbi:MAG TPA: hypothetical protein VGF65_07170, partial [Mycobacterium sp.]